MNHKPRTSETIILWDSVLGDACKKPGGPDVLYDSELLVGPQALVTLDLSLRRNFITLRPLLLWTKQETT